MDFSLIDRAGVSQGQFAQLVGVSRITVNTWVKARFKPRGSIRVRVIKLLSLLEAAITDGRLPVPVSDRRAETEAVLNALREALDTNGA